jgi:predicted  nucleic acid-binding Zn-ribbon protein
MNATNNLALAQRGTVVVNHDNKAMNEQATKQDLHNQGIQIDSEFVKVDSQLVILRTDMNAGFDRVDGQFTNLRTDMDAKFTKVDSQITNLRTDMDAKFTKVDSQITNLRTDMNAGFERVDSQFTNLRTDMDAKFDKANDALNKTFFKFGSLYFTMMFAVLSIDRWWR